MKRQELSNTAQLPPWEARELLEWVLEDSHETFLLHLQEEVPEEKAALFLRLAQKRRSGYPLQYLLGEWDFYGLRFFVGEGVLIPRSDSEILVETALQILQRQPSPLVCDLCSGSGCLAIALAKHLPESAQLTAVELSAPALAYLKKNIAYHHCSNVSVITADVCTWETNTLFDLIVSNPPYLARAELQDLQTEVTYEPELALVAEEEGLFFYKMLAKKVRRFLKPGGSVAFEVGYRQAEAVAAILLENHYHTITKTKDWNGIDRVVTGVL